MAHFGGWLRENRASVDRVTEDHVERFLDEFIPQSHKAFIRRRVTVAAAIHFVLSLIREKHPLAQTQTPAQAETDRYVEHLRHNRGLAEGTITHHRRELQGFLRACFGQKEIRLPWITPAGLIAHVETIPGPPKYRRHQVCAALRGYFQFLQLQGVSTRHLSASIPRVRVSRASLSPKVVAPADVKRLLQEIGHSTATKKRDYAAVLCMYDLGMRRGDVARLSLDDINWREGTVRVANHKRGRPYKLPLPKRLGRALADYLATGLPSSSCREVFLRCDPPYGKPATPAAFTANIRRAWKRCGRQDRSCGTHILRHSAATRMKQAGVGLKSIADVLGHNSLQSTALYAQVDLPTLRKTAQPWPEA
jgi:site-specific recombinase XerD